MNNMSSGMSVFCIQEGDLALFVKIEQHAGIVGQTVAEHQALLAGGRRVGHLDRKGEIALIGVDGQPVLVAAGRRGGQRQHTQKRGTEAPRHG